MPQSQKKITKQDIEKIDVKYARALGIDGQFLGLKRTITRVEFLPAGNFSWQTQPMLDIDDTMRITSIGSGLEAHCPRCNAITL